MAVPKPFRATSLRQRPRKFPRASGAQSGADGPTHHVLTRLRRLARDDDRRHATRHRASLRGPPSPRSADESQRPALHLPARRGPARTCREAAIRDSGKPTGCNDGTRGHRRRCTRARQGRKARQHSDACRDERRAEPGGTARRRQASRAARGRCTSAGRQYSSRDQHERRGVRHDITSCQQRAGHRRGSTRRSSRARCGKTRDQRSASRRHTTIRGSNTAGNRSLAARRSSASRSPQPGIRRRARRHRSKCGCNRRRDTRADGGSAARPPGHRRRCARARQGRQTDRDTDRSRTDGTSARADARPGTRREAGRSTCQQRRTSSRSDARNRLRYSSARIHRSRTRSGCDSRRCSGCTGTSLRRARRSRAHSRHDA